jgi:hypothetical protein
MGWLPVLYPLKGTRCVVLRAQHGEPPAPLVAYMNPRPSLWRQYVRGPLREAFWMSIGALSVLTLAVAGLVLGEYVPPMIYHWGER